MVLKGVLFSSIHFRGKTHSFLVKDCYHSSLYITFFQEKLKVFQKNGWSLKKEKKLEKQFVDMKYKIVSTDEFVVRCLFVFFK